jgi:hypothetical protein
MLCLHDLDDANTPLSCLVGRSALPESMEGRFDTSIPTIQTALRDHGIGDPSPLVNNNGYVPYHPDKPCFLANLFFIPHVVPSQLKVKGEHSKPLFLDNVGYHMVTLQ